MSNDKTTVIDTKSIISASTKQDLKSICDDLDERGYNSIKQIVAYLVSGDPGYISSYKDCRTRIATIKREDLLEALLVDFLNK